MVAIIWNIKRQNIQYWRGLKKKCTFWFPQLLFSLTGCIKIELTVLFYKCIIKKNLKTINELQYIHLLYNKQLSNFMSMLCSRFEHWKSDWKTRLYKRTRSEDHNKGFTPSFRACHILFGPLLPATFPLGVFPTYGPTHAYVIVSAWTTEGECVKIHTIYLPFPVFGSIFLWPVVLQTAGKWS